ncbi:MAG TPA: hypothetical protein VFB42_13010 [Gaiellaceae bacterium]|nr:hypothetical protein [Gaiellaceae bacterium]
MHPQFRIDVLRERSRQFERDVRRSALLARPAAPAAPVEERVSLRLCCVHDDPALERLALLEGRPLPRGRFVLAEVDGEVVAALPLRGGAALADPFRPTAHLLPLLRLRAEQLRRALAEPDRRGVLARLSLHRGRA